MKEIRIYLVPLVLAAFAFTMFSGCAALQTNQVSDVEGLLTKAGFQKHVADTPQKLAHLKTLAQHRISRHKRHGKLYFVYADASDCQCLYAGGEEAFRHFSGSSKRNRCYHIEQPIEN
jgi:hypothetical protein